MVFVMPAPKTQAACTRNVDTLKLDTLAESFTLRAKQEGKTVNKWNMWVKSNAQKT